MRATSSSGGLRVRVIAGTHNVLLGIDLDEAGRAGCLGFSIWRTDLGPTDAPFPADQQVTRALPSGVRFPSDTSTGPTTTEHAPLQRFRWGDYTADPNHRYRYGVTAQYGAATALTAGPSVEIEITTEDPTSRDHSVYFNRAAAASQAYIRRFGDTDPADSPEARAWLSRGLEEAILAFLSQARDASFGLHAAIYEFQRPELLQGLKAAHDRGADVQVVYHYRHNGDKDDTWKKNEAAAQANGLADLCVQRKANPRSAIMHDKFVVLLEKDTAGSLQPIAVWTGSTNWTDGGVYGQLNVGHAVYDATVAQAYEALFQLLRADSQATPLKNALAKLTPIPDLTSPGPRISPIFSPQHDKRMLELYAAICKQATCLMVSAPFELDALLLNTFASTPPGALHFLLLDKEASLGGKEEVTVIEREAGNEIAIAATLDTHLDQYQSGLLQHHFEKESFHHPGIHIHSKIIAADPFGPDPIVVSGSANYSANSTLGNDSNTLVIRGNLAVADIYATEFMRMFDHYHFRATLAKAERDAKAAGKPFTETAEQLKEDDTWSAPYYVADSREALERQTFSGSAPESG